MNQVLPKTHDEPEIPKQIGRYTILCELGHGSMAVLYLGRAGGVGGFERLFAIKMIHEHLSRENAFVDMFLNEARIAARIHHPNVIPVYDVAKEKGRYYLSMDYVSGETLGLVLKSTWGKGQAFPPELACHVLASVAEGLHAAHELKDADGKFLGVVHRDVAPQNIMIGYDGIVRLMDFGIAKALDTISYTRPGVMKGTIAYMAPEQVRCQPLDMRSDVFAVGTVLWESTVGMRLFKHENDLGTAARVLKLPIPKPTTIRADYPPRLETIVLKALERDPGARYQSARELALDLQEFLAKSSRRITAADIESFMKRIFPDRFAQRADMERAARDNKAPTQIFNPQSSDNSESLSAVPVDQELDVDDVEGVLLIDRSDRSKVPALPDAGKPAQASNGSMGRIDQETSAIPLPGSPPGQAIPTGALPVGGAEARIRTRLPTLIIRETKLEAETVLAKAAAPESAPTAAATIRNEHGEPGGPGALGEADVEPLVAESGDIVSTADVTRPGDTKLVHAPVVETISSAAATRLDEAVPRDREATRILNPALLNPQPFAPLPRLPEESQPLPLVSEDELTSELARMSRRWPMFLGAAAALAVLVFAVTSLFPGEEPDDAETAGVAEVSEIRAGDRATDEAPVPPREDEARAKQPEVPEEPAKTETAPVPPVAEAAPLPSEETTRPAAAENPPDDTQATSPSFRAPEDAPPPKTPETVTIDIAVEPADAIVRVNGRLHEGPLVAPRSDSSYQITVEKPGFKRQQTRVTAERTTTLEIKLEAEVRPAPIRPAKRPPVPGRVKPAEKPKGKASNALLFEGDDL